MYQMCDLDGLIKLYPYAVIHIFYCSINLLIAGSKYAPYLPAKLILRVAVFTAGLNGKKLASIPELQRYAQAKGKEPMKKLQHIKLHERYQPIRRPALVELALLHKQKE